MINIQIYLVQQKLKSNINWLRIQKFDSPGLNYKILIDSYGCRFQ